MNGPTQISDGGGHHKTMTDGPAPVLYVSHHADIVGGGEISLLALLKDLDRNTWSPIMIVPGEGQVAEQCRAMDIPTHVVPMPSCRWPSAAMKTSVRILSDLISGRRARLVHANGSRAMVYAGLARRGTRARVVWHVRVADSDGLLDRLLALLADRIIVNSQAVGRRFSFAPSDKVVCIHNGVDPADYAPVPTADLLSLRRTYGIPSTAPVVVSVGRFVPYKGYRFLIQAAHRLTDYLPRIHWLLVGDGDERSDLERLSKDLGLEQVVHFTGWLARPQLALAVGDVFVLPSLGEHFGRVLIEAMAMRKAVVATNAGGVREIVKAGHTGVLIPPSDPQSLAQAVQGLLANPLLATYLGDSGRRRVEQCFTLDRHVQAVGALYESLMDQP
jgi:glycosyltransferase involved in cell wall biosynthesis